MTIMSLLKRFPLVRGNCSPQNRFHLPQKHPHLRHGKLGVGWNGLPVLAMNHELMARAGIQAVKTQRAKPADEFTPFKWSPSGHVELCSS